jgi:transposase
MERLSLREAAERTARSVTTLRRYIRAGRLQAQKAPGRFGPEYFVTEEDQIRRETIMRVMCDLSLDFATVSRICKARSRLWMDGVSCAALFMS